MLGWAQQRRRHNWTDAKGPVQHRDLWEQILNTTERLGEQVIWLHTPSHIDIPGNSRADHLADVGRRRSPLLYGQVSAHEEPEEEEEEDEPIEGWEEWEPEEEVDEQQPLPPKGPTTGHAPETGPRRTGGDRAHPPPPASPLWDIEVCTPVLRMKRPRLHTPIHLSLVKMPRPVGEAEMPATPSWAVTPYQIGPVRMTLRTPQGRSPMSPRVSLRPLDILNLIPMDDNDQLASVHDSLRPVESHTSTSTTLTISTEGSHCILP